MALNTMHGLILGIILVLFRTSLQVEGCVNVRPLGVANRTAIADLQLSASSSFRQSVDYLTAKHGRLYATRGWCPASLGGNDWLQVDMGNYYNVCGVATQGKYYRTREWTTNYTLSTSLDGVKWKGYTENKQLKVLAGNVDAVSVVRHKVTSVWARYIRFYPQGYQVWPCLRVEILVELTPPVITVGPRPQTLAVSSNLLLDCSSVGSPKPKVTWSLNGNDIIFGKVLFNDSLLVKSVENDKNFEGDYRCIATNKEGSASIKAMVTIHEKPKILKLLSPSSQRLKGETAILSCYGEGDPVPSTTWTKDGSVYMPRATIHAEGHVLVINDVSVIDQGAYQCTLWNYLGTATSSTNLTIIDRPSIDTVRTRQTIQASLHHTINVGCYGSSILPLTYTWSKNNIAVRGGNHSDSTVRVFGNLLVLIPRKGQDYGTYVCHVKNTVDTTIFGIDVVPFYHERNSSAAAALNQSYITCKAPLGIIIPLVIIFLLSLTLNARLIYRYRRMKNANDVSKAIPLTKMSNEVSNLIKDTETPWDNIILEGQGGPYVNAGIEREKQTQ